MKITRVFIASKSLSSLSLSHSHSMGITPTPSSQWPEGRQLCILRFQRNGKKQPLLIVHQHFSPEPRFFKNQKTGLSSPGCIRARGTSTDLKEERQPHSSLRFAGGSAYPDPPPINFPCPSPAGSLDAAAATLAILTNTPGPTLGNCLLVSCFR